MVDFYHWFHFAGVLAMVGLALASKHPPTQSVAFIVACGFVYTWFAWIFKLPEGETFAVLDALAAWGCVHFSDRHRLGFFIASILGLQVAINVMQSIYPTDRFIHMFFLGSLYFLQWATVGGFAYHMIRKPRQQKEYRGPLLKWAMKPKH